MNSNLFYFLFLLAGCAANIKLDLTKDSPAEIRHNLSIFLNVIDGAAVGDGASPGIFYRIADSLISVKRDSVYNEFLQDTNPNVRILGLYCMANSNIDKYMPILEQYVNDTTNIDYQPLGCFIESQTLGYIVSEIINNPRFLDISNYKK